MTPYDLISFSWPYYGFHRPMLEREGYFSIEKDGKQYILLNVLGLGKEDIKVDVDNGENNTQVLTITGSKHNDLFDRDFSIRARFISQKEMKEVESTVENGFMTLMITFAEPVKPSVKILSR